MIDARGIPSNECLNCGYNVFVVPCAFEDYDIAWWALEGTCYSCGSPVTVPCPVDRPDLEALD